jgi:hypothetical protein
MWEGSGDVRKIGARPKLVAGFDLSDVNAGRDVELRSWSVGELVGGKDCY